MAGIYIHIPFCKQACYYCDFHFSTSVKRKSEMVAAIKKELDMRQSEVKETIDTIYFGGGTPSLLSDEELCSILNHIDKFFSVSNEAEITLEANPDDLDNKRIQTLAETPVNRLSIGIQSFFEQDLVYMNRAHSSADSKRVLEAAKKLFDNITIDLIYGIPEMSNERWSKNLRYALEAGIQHISSYALTVEPKTALDHFIKKGKYAPLSENLAKEHFEILQEASRKKGFIQYEISNFGKENYFSRHNTSYWKGISYLGVGPAAHSYDGDSRSWNVANNAKYLSAIHKSELPSEKEYLSIEDKINESILTGLRTIWGCSLNKVEASAGLHFKKLLLKQAERYLNKNLMRLENDHLILEPQAYFMADGIAADLFIVKD